MLDREVSDGEPMIPKDQKGNIAASAMASSKEDSMDFSADHSEDGEPKKILIRHTKWRWVMLAAGCFFLMGSYFCFDNPAPLKNTLLKEPYNLTNT